VWEDANRKCCDLLEKRYDDLFLPEFPKSFCDSRSLNPTFSNQSRWSYQLQLQRNKLQYIIRKHIHYQHTVLVNLKVIRLPPKSSSRAWLPVVMWITDFLCRIKQWWGLNLKRWYKSEARTTWFEQSNQKWFEHLLNS